MLTAVTDEHAGVYFVCQKCRKSLQVTSGLQDSSLLSSFRTSLPLPSHLGVEYSQMEQRGLDELAESFVVLPGQEANAVTGPSDTDEKTNTQWNEKMVALTQIFEVMSDKCQLDHPLCQPCAEELHVQLQARIRSAQEAYATYQKTLDEFDSSEKTRQAAKGTAGAGTAEVAAATAKRQAEKEAALGAELQRIRDEREMIRQEEEALSVQSREFDALERRFWREFHDFQHERARLLKERGTQQQRVESAQAELERLRRTNVYDDAFHIYYDGHFGTINDNKTTSDGTDDDDDDDDGDGGVNVVLAVNHLEDKLWHTQHEDMFSGVDMSVVLDTAYGMSPADYFNTFFADSAGYGMLDYFEHRKEDSIEVDPWVFHEQLGHTRTINFVTAVPDAPPLYPKKSRISMTQRYHFHATTAPSASEHVSLDMFVETASLDVPYGSSFRILEKWQVTPIDAHDDDDGDDDDGGSAGTGGSNGGGGERCRLRIYVGVRFIQRVWGVKNVISSRVRRDVTLGYELWSTLTHAHLANGGGGGTPKPSTKPRLPPLPSIAEEDTSDAAAAAAAAAAARGDQSVGDGGGRGAAGAAAGGLMDGVLQPRLNVLHMAGILVLALIIYWLWGLTTSVHSLSSSVQSIVDMQRQGGPLQSQQQAASQAQVQVQAQAQDQAQKALLSIIEQLTRDVHAMKQAIEDKNA